MKVGGHGRGASVQLLWQLLWLCCTAGLVLAASECPYVREDGTVSTQGHAEAAHKPHAHTARQKENIGVKVTQRLQQAKAALRHWLVEPDEVVRSELVRESYNACREADALANHLIETLVRKHQTVGCMRLCMAMMEAEKPEDERDESRVADLVKFGRKALEDMKPQDDDLGLRTVIPQVAEQFLAAHQRKRADEDKAKRAQHRLADRDRHRHT